jgi:hypothetical protein
MTIRELWEDKKTRYLIDENMLLGHIAMWAVRQSPYTCPTNLKEALSLIKRFIEADPLNVWIMGMPTLRMAKFTFFELEEFLDLEIKSNGYFSDWNKPKTRNEVNGEEKMGLPVCRYSNIDPDYDFIDLDALVRNIAGSVINEVISNEEVKEKAA